jgi:adenosylcobinamide amidohydrolase
MGKTDTIDDRRVDVYSDTVDQKERWARLAEEEGESLSKFVQKCVKYAIERNDAVRITISCPIDPLSDS